MIASGWSRISQIGAPIPKGGRQHSMKIKKIGPRGAQETSNDCCPQVIKYAANERSTLGSIRANPSCTWPKWSCLYARSITLKGLKWTKLSMEVGGYHWCFVRCRGCAVCATSQNSEKSMSDTQFPPSVNNTAEHKPDRSPVHQLKETKRKLCSCLRQWFFCISLCYRDVRNKHPNWKKIKQ